MTFNLEWFFNRDSNGFLRLVGSGFEFDEFEGMVVKEERGPVFDFGADEVVGGVPVNGHDGGFFEENGFGLRKNGHALVDVGGVFCLVEEFFEFGRGPSGVIVAVAAGPHFEESGRVEVVADPACGREIVICGVLFLEVIGPFALHDADFDAEVLLPHRLQGFGFAPAGIGVRREETDVRKTAGVGVAGFGEEFFGKFGIVMDHAGRRVAAEGRDDAAGGFLAALKNFVANRLLIDGEGKSAADFGIVKRWALGVAAQKADTDVGFLAELFGEMLFSVGDKLGRYGVSEVQLVVAEHARFGVVIGDREVADTVERDRFGVPIIRVALDLDEVVCFPGFEFERPV